MTTQEKYIPKEEWIEKPYKLRGKQEWSAYGQKIQKSGSGYICHLKDQTVKTGTLIGMAWMLHHLTKNS